ncbi:sorting and assembly machinery component 50 homolog B-like [Watersipora subatra]|uniref:sorting and assembly machinery component 50 homolog B-like n=1 Tax=Watersipora subatra TaxID=2589382 RepID=UPI00355B8894
MAEDTLNNSLEDILARPIHISKIFIHGLLRTKEDFAKNVSRKLFDAKTLREYLESAQDVQATFNNLGVTKGVGLKLDVSDDGSEGLFVHVNLVEKKRWAGAVKGFMGNDADAKIGIGGGLNASGLFPNLLGRGEKLSCCWQQALENNRKEIVFQKPTGTDYDSVASTSAYSYSGNVVLSGFKEQHTGVTLDRTINYSDFMHKFSWLGVWRQLLPLSDKTAWSVREQAGHSLKSSLKHEMTFDSRDDVILPSQGIIFRLSQELAGLGGDCHFYSKQLSLQLNQVLPKSRIVGQVGCSVGHVQPLNFTAGSVNKPLSILDKFYLGGPTSLRGFENKGIGPREGENALAADFFWLGYASLLLPPPGVRGGLLDKFRLQLFVNCGNCSNWNTESSWKKRYQDQLSTMRLTYGAGIVTNFLGAKMELNYCFPIKHQRHDKVQSGFQFGISVGD